MGQTVRVSSAPTGVVPVLRSRHSTAPHTCLQQVHGLAPLRVHPVLLHAEVDPLLEGLAQRVAIEERDQDTDDLHQQDSSNTDAVL